MSLRDDDRRHRRAAPGRGLGASLELSGLDLPVLRLPDVDASALARRGVGGALAGALAAGGLVGGAATARADDDIPVPAVPDGLGPVDPYAALDQQSTCDPEAKPGVIRFRRLVLSTYPDTGDDGIVVACSSPGVTEHKEGRAWDWAIRYDNPHQRAEVAALLDWLLAPDEAGNPAAMARRLGVMYVIWDRHMWRAYRPELGWQPYEGVSEHRDHVHFSFSRAGAMGRTSFWHASGVAPLPERLRRYRDAEVVLRPGAVGPAVRALQQALGVPVTGRYAARTRSAVLRLQRDAGLEADGVVGPATWSRLLVLTGGSPHGLPVLPQHTGRRGAPGQPSTAPAVPHPDVTVSLVRADARTVLRPGASGPAVLVLQRLLGATPTERFDAATVRAVRAWQRAHHLPDDGVVGPRTWATLLPEAHAYELRWWAQERRRQAAARAAAAAKARAERRARLLAEQHTVLRLGARGPAVTLLQQALGVAPDGRYGVGTSGAVSGFQRRHGLPADGVCGPATWRALAAAV